MSKIPRKLHCSFELKVEGQDTYAKNIENHVVIVPDMRGHGMSEAPRDGDMPLDGGSGVRETEDWALALLPPECGRAQMTPTTASPDMNKNKPKRTVFLSGAVLAGRIRNWN